MLPPFDPSAIQKIEDFPWKVVGIGAPKCATTWVARNLATIPDFFQTGERDLFSGGAVTSGYFREYFADVLREFMLNPHRICSTYFNLYLYDGFALRFLKRRHPKVKIYVCLRNPLARTVSAHLHNMVWSGIYGPETSMEDALKLHASSGILEMSYYERYLPAWINAFGRENVYVFISEEIRANPFEILNDFTNFAGARPVMPSALQKDDINKNIIDKIHVDPRTMDQLYQSFAPTMDYVQELIGRDLSQLWSNKLRRVEAGAHISQDQILLARALQHYENGPSNYKEALKLLVPLYDKRYPHELVYSLLAKLMESVGQPVLADRMREAGRLICQGLTNDDNKIPSIILEI